MCDEERIARFDGPPSRGLLCGVLGRVRSGASCIIGGASCLKMLKHFKMVTAEH